MKYTKDKRDAQKSQEEALFGYKCGVSIATQMSGPYGIEISQSVICPIYLTDKTLHCQKNLGKAVVLLVAERALDETQLWN